MEVRNYVKRFLAMAMAIIMVMTSFPFNAFAVGEDHNNLDKSKSEIINSNKNPVNPAKTDNAADLIKNPDQPEIYTLRTDYKVQKGDKYEINYQPYIASVGAAATDAEKGKVNKTIKLPDLAGYDKSQLDDEYKIDYETVKNAGKGSQEFRYKAKPNEIKIKHLFQDMNDFTKYTNLGGEDKPEKITTQNGNTGSTMEVSPLNENERRGFVPEADYITMQVPEDATDFVLEYRYNRAHYNVDFDTADGTPLPTRTYYFDQEIPKIENIPTKIGCEFQGWMPSHDLQTTDGKTYKANQIITKADGTPTFDLDVHLKMPGLLLGKDEKTRERLKFTAVWKDKEKADYAIQFWVEKSDHADDASLLEKYDYMGTRVHKDAKAGSTPTLDEESVKGLKFPDLNQARLEKIWNGDKFNQGRNIFLDKFFVYNKALTDDQNKDSETKVTKTVSATGKTVYNIYYDRQVYDLYFTKSNALSDKETFYPSIYKPDGKGGAKQVGGPGNLFHYKARFNEMMYDWPDDAMQTKGFSPGWQSFGWGANYADPHWPVHLDTPPYRLNADEFLDMPNYDNWGGYVNKIDDGNGGTIDASDFRTLSFGIKQQDASIPHHMDFWMDGFKPGETIIRYDLVRTKADTASLDYGHRYPRVEGFMPYGYNPNGQWPAIHEGRVDNGRVNANDVDELNDEREEITPNDSGKRYDIYGFKKPIGELKFIPAFFNNADEFGDPLDGEESAFKENGYLQFKYTRNKYPLRFNYDPSIIRDDSYFNSTNQLATYYQFPLKVLSPVLVDSNLDREDREYFKEDPKNLLDNPENLKKLGLTDLVYADSKDDKLKVKRPEGLSDQMEFKGWALDPAGTKLIWENPKETMPTHPLNLYAKWGEPDFKWKVTFDPDGGRLKTIKEENLTTERKTIQEGDIGQEEVNTYAKKGYLKEEPTTPDGKQIFTVVQRQKLVKPVKPVKKGYDFMGWEVIRYKKNEKGDYTDEVDTSYRDRYGVPELYTFGNDVVSPIYLKAIWNPNQRVDVKVTHHFLDKDCKKDGDPLVEYLENKRTGYYTATTGDQQGQKWILAPHEELEKSQDQEIADLYKKYNGDFGFNNTYFQNQRIEPKEIKDPNSEEMIANPEYKGNEFHFFYRPFRQREYTVNYLDERGKAEVEKFFKDLELTSTDGLSGDALLEANQANKAKFEAKKSELKEVLDKYQVVDPEAVTNGNRHYDARNYRPIPGWALTSAPQQQLFFDLDEGTNEFLGINGTGGDQLFFYYKDVRVIEVPGDKNPPDGYVRVTFRADKGGSFTDNTGKSATELHYDVIKGLKSDLLPVPQELKEGVEKASDLYYVTPEAGKKFTKWDDKPLLNANTIINENHTFTAYFEWSGLTAGGLVTTEAFKDPNGKWINNFAPTIDQLKKQLVWKEKDQVKDLPVGTTIKFYDEAGKELTTDDQIYDLVNEKKAADKDEVVRTVNIKVKATFKDGKESQELNIPITIYKNVYEALTTGEKPLFLSDAEKGELKDITGEYVKVTVNPTGKPGEKDSKIYYVNPKAWVEIPEIKLTDEEKANLGFTNWTADKDVQNENGIYDFDKRHKFTEDTVISPGFSKDVVPQEGEDKPKVPDNFVKVIVKTTDKATDETKFEKTFWVNPTKEVTIPVANPTGKSDQEVDIPKLGKKKVNYVFNQWQKVKVGETEDNLAEVKPAVKIELAKNQYTDKVTVIEASYFERFAATPIVKPIKTDELHTPEGKEITDKDLIGKITPPKNKEIESITVVEKPDPSKPGKQEAKVTIKYKDGSTQGTNDKPVVIPVEVHKNIIPEAPGGQKPKDALDNYVKVIFNAGTGGSVSGDLVYYVSPDVEVDMTESAKAVTKTPSVGYFVNGEKWTNNDNKALKGTFKDAETEFIFNFEKDKDIVEKIDENTKIPEGYVKVTFKTDGNGKVDDKDKKIYYVNPKAGITLKVLDEGEKATDKQLAVPMPEPNANYTFKEWQENIDENTSITSERVHVAIFQSGQVTLTYESGEGATGDAPEAVTVNYGTTVQLAGKGSLVKENSEFAGWKLDGEEKIYQPGDSVKLEKARTATAQWTPIEYTVMFDLAGGTIDGKTRKDSINVKHGETIEKVDGPILDGKVFMGWKDKETDAIFDFTKPITKDKVLVAQWQDAVQKIDEDAKVEEQFIKVTFKEGDHGKLKLADVEQDKPVSYKVAKDYDLNKAIQAGLVVPDIAPAKYYKTQEENAGWDKDLKLDSQNIEFTAQYQPQADVIPVDPKVIDEEQIQKEKPEGMVLVTFKVTDDTKLYIPNNSKYYVKKDIEVRIPTPVVLAKTNDAVFNGWQEVNIVNETIDPDNSDSNGEKFIWVKQSFKDDTVISDNKTDEIELLIKKTSVGDKRIFIDQMSDDSIGKFQLIRAGKVIETATNRKYTRRRKEYNVFDLTNALQSGDAIRYWQESSSRTSDATIEVID